MSEHSCTITNCVRLARVLCYCCKQNYCIEHIKDHNEVYLSELYQLTNEVNHVSELYRDHYRQQLDQWRHQSHQTIDSYYEKKCQQLDRMKIHDDKFNQNRQVLEWIQMKIVQLIRAQNATHQQIQSLKAAINAIQREFNETLHENLQLDIPPLILNDDLIQFDKSKVNFNLYSTIQSELVRKSLSKDDCIVMTNNSKYFLIGHQEYLCLFDKNLNLIKQISWIHGCIRDMCTSNTLGKFIIIAENDIFTLDEQTMNIEKEQQVFSKINQSWYCCTCSDKSLFLTTQKLHSTIEEYGIGKNTFSFQRKQICCTENEYIEHMKCSNNETLALIILNQLTNERRLDLRCTETYNQLWTISLQIDEKINILSCCSLNEKGWLIVNFADNRLLHITTQGEIKQKCFYQSSPLYAVQLEDQFLAILTEQGVSIYQIQ
ncbi:hypothetical protein I4U23_006573 [Adineta vaga]|nr:hypothetical protein I4U23_006573 [Adineta vaga]